MGEGYPNETLKTRDANLPPPSRALFFLFAPFLLSAKLSHRLEWVEGNKEEGYLTGMIALHVGNGRLCVLKGWGDISNVDTQAMTQAHG